VGMTSKMINKTTPAKKKLLGRLAYVLAVVRQSNLFKLRRYMLWVDGRPRLIRAAEVMISSTTLMEKPHLLFGPPATLGDGQCEIYVVTARTLGDYARLAWDLVYRRPGRPAAKLSHWTARQSVRVDCFGRSLLVQADGEMIGHTPVEIRLVPRAIRVIRPRQAAVSRQE